ncbi:MAG TPA: MarR family winged helix-turn-helix transcriptional regulator [Dongiaceae bacterium]
MRAAIVRRKSDPAVSFLCTLCVELFIAFLAFICVPVCEGQWFALFTYNWFGYDMNDCSCLTETISTTNRLRGIPILMADEVSSKLLSGLNRIGLAMRSAAWGDATESGLTPTQSQILAFIASRAAQNPRSGDAADALGITPQTASVAIAALVAKGLVAKVADPSDRRASALRLTRQGEVAARVAGQWPDFLMSAVQELDEAERKLFLRILIKLIRRLQNDGQIVPQRLCVTCVHFQPNAHPGNPGGPHHCAYVDAPLSELDLRLDCPDHRAASTDAINAAWASFLRVAKG